MQLIAEEDIAGTDALRTKVRASNAAK